MTDDLTTDQLIALLACFDKGDDVTVDQYDDALDQLQNLAYEGDQTAQMYFDDLADVD